MIRARPVVDLDEAPQRAVRNSRGLSRPCFRSAALLGFNCFVDEAWPASGVVHGDGATSRTAQKLQQRHGRGVAGGCSWTCTERPPRGRTAFGAPDRRRSCTSGASCAGRRSDRRATASRRTRLRLAQAPGCARHPHRRLPACGGSRAVRGPRRQPTTELYLSVSPYAAMPTRVPGIDRCLYVILRALRCSPLEPQQLLSLLRLALKSEAAGGPIKERIVIEQKGR